MCMFRVIYKSSVTFAIYYHISNEVFWVYRTLVVALLYSAVDCIY